jgi:hypothetical protein
VAHLLSERSRLALGHAKDRVAQAQAALQVRLSATGGPALHASAHHSALSATVEDLPCMQVLITARSTPLAGLQALQADEVAREAERRRRSHAKQRSHGRNAELAAAGTLMATDDLPGMQVLTTARPRAECQSRCGRCGGGTGEGGRAPLPARWKERPSRGDDLPLSATDGLPHQARWKESVDAAVIHEPLGEASFECRLSAV